MKEKNLFTKIIPVQIDYSVAEPSRAINHKNFLTNF